MVVWWIRSAERLWTRAFCTQHHTLEHGHNDTSGGAAAQGHERRRLPAGGARQSEGLVELTSLSASNAARIAARGHHQVARHAACQAARHAAARRTTKRTRARRLVAGGAHGVSSHASIASVSLTRLDEAPCSEQQVRFRRVRLRFRRVHPRAKHGESGGEAMRRRVLGYPGRLDPIHARGACLRCDAPTARATCARGIATSRLL